MPTAMDDTNTQTIKLIGLQNALFTNTSPKTGTSSGMLEDQDGPSESEHTYLREAIGTEVRLKLDYRSQFCSGLLDSKLISISVLMNLISYQQVDQILLNLGKDDGLAGFLLSVSEIKTNPPEEHPIEIGSHKQLLYKIQVRCKYLMTNYLTKTIDEEA